MRTSTNSVIAPDFPDNSVWLNGEPRRLDAILRNGPLLVEFWDFARVNSLRTLPYFQRWHERYSALGLTVVGVHTPGYSCSRTPEAVEAAVARLGVMHSVIVDSDLAVWNRYGNRGWPARYLWSAGGVLKHWHYGEGNYAETEQIIQEELDRYLERQDVYPDWPAAVGPVRPEDAPGPSLEAQTADVNLPADIARVSLTGEWEHGEDFIESVGPGTITAPCAAGEAWAVLSGPAAPYPGCTRLSPPSDGTARIETTDRGLRVHGLQFTPILRQTG